MPKKILVVEDNENNRYLVTFLLQKHGYEVVAARCGKEALEVAKREMPDLVLLDIQLPEMDGLETARIMRETSELEDIPIFAVTSYAMPGDRERALAVGCVGYVEKPFDPKALLSEIQKLLADTRHLQKGAVL